MKNIESFQEFIDARQEERELRYADLDERYKTDFKEFTIENFELQALDEWKTEHGKHCRKRAYSYKFSRANGIGMAVSVECDCGANQDITDYDSW